jgi:hypothetical protein
MNVSAHCILQDMEARSNDGHYSDHSLFTGHRLFNSDSTSNRCNTEPFLMMVNVPLVITVFERST